MPTDTSPRTAIKKASPIWPSLIAWFLLLVGLVLLSENNFVEMWIRWFPTWGHQGKSLYDRIVGGQSYYTHGPLVPPVCILIAYLLIRFTRIELKPRPVWGLLLLGLGILLHLVSCLARVNFTGSCAMIAVLGGVVLILWGARALWRLWFPLAFLAFMIPIPEVSIAQLNFRLKMFATDWGVTLSKLLFVFVERSGNRVFLQGDKILVIANVCGGLRTLITVIAFGALYAYVCRLRGVWRLVLFAMSVPVALVANAIRIVSLIIVADIWGTKVATGSFHDASGAMIFILSFLMMFGVERLLIMIPGISAEAQDDGELMSKVRRSSDDKGQGARMFSIGGRLSSWVLVVLIMFSAAGAWWLNLSVPPVRSGGKAKAALPVTLTIDNREWRGQDLKMSQDVLDILETDDYLYRTYRSPGRVSLRISVVFSKDNRKGTHPPDLCLEGAGEGVMQKGRVMLDGVEGIGDVRCRELVVQSTSGRSRYFLYVYKCGKTYTPDFLSQQLIILWNGLTNRNASGALIRISSDVGSGGVEESRKRCSMFLRACLPLLHEGLP